MISKKIERPTSTPKNLQRTFENAVRDIYQVGLTGHTSQYRTPILQRPDRDTTVSPANAEKRALTDAAKALAQLWKIAPNVSR